MSEEEDMYNDETMDKVEEILLEQNPDRMTPFTEKERMSILCKKTVDYFEVRVPKYRSPACTEFFKLLDDQIASDKAKRQRTGNSSIQFLPRVQRKYALPVPEFIKKENITEESIAWAFGGSSPSVLSEGDDDPLELDATLSALEDDDDDLSALNSILQTGSPGSLSNEEVLDDDLQSDNSSLSSAPDDFPLSRSASPEAPEEVSRKRKGEQPDQGPSKRSKAEESVEGQEEKGDGSETDSKNELKEEKKEIPERKEEEDEKEKEDEKKVGIDLQEGKEEEKMDSEIAENDEDYQQRHKEALDALTHIELEFARLRDKMYQEKMSELNDEALMIANGTHPELVSLMAEIEEKKGKRISSAEAWREHQYANFKKQRDLLSDIHNKKWSMENERKKLNEVSTDRLLLFPDGREMMLHKRELKEETSELSEMKETIGFPMAPNPKGLNSQDIDEDLRLLGIHHS
ncbi:hypothetical protein G6F63_012208 [Rhizopus arrhizus]|nr:hypothetical protein G6F63_012208 [Rhizopus arrhizus]